MESVSLIKDILDGKLVLGNKEEITEDLYIIPVYKVKMSFLNLKTDLKENSGDGVSGSINVNPICLLKVYKGNLDVINFKEEKDHIFDNVSNILSNIDFNDVLKNIKFI